MIGKFDIIESAPNETSELFDLLHSVCAAPIHLLDPAPIDGVLRDPYGPVITSTTLRSPYFRAAAVMTDQAAIATDLCCKSHFVLGNSDLVSQVIRRSVWIHREALSMSDNSSVAHPQA